MNTNPKQTTAGRVAIGAALMIFVACVLALTWGTVQTSGQFNSPEPVTTPYSRNLLRQTNAAGAQGVLEVASGANAITNFQKNPTVTRLNVTNQLGSGGAGSAAITFYGLSGSAPAQIFFSDQDPFASPIGNPGFTAGTNFNVWGLINVTNPFGGMVPFSQGYEVNGQPSAGNLLTNQVLWAGPGGSQDGSTLTGVVAANAGSLGNTPASSFLTVPHEGFVGSNTRINYDGPSTALEPEFMCRDYSMAMSRITNVQVAFANFTSGGEVGDGGTLLVRATIEYPSNNFTRLTFNGSTNVLIPSGAMVISDFSNVVTTIPEGAMFWVRMWESNGAGVFFNFFGNTNYDGTTYGPTESDLTGGGTVPMVTAANQGISSPLAILGITTKQNVIIIGDSRAEGIGEIGIPSIQIANTIGDPSTSYGYSRIFESQHYTTLNLAANGETWFNFNNSSNRFWFCTNFSAIIVSEYGINDLAGSGSAFTCETNLSRFAGLVYPDPVVATTLEPETTSSDNWSTLAGQSLTSFNAARVSYNTFLRNGQATGVKSVLDVSSLIESSFNSGKWNTDGSSNWLTQDGVHPSTTALKLYAAGIPNAFYGPVNIAASGGIGTGLTLSGTFSGAFSGNYGTNFNGIVLATNSQFHSSIDDIYMSTPDNSLFYTIQSVPALEDSFFGYQAGYPGIFNGTTFDTYVGYEASQNGNGSFNTGLGAQAMIDNIGSDGVAIGYNSLLGGVGNNNVAIGYNSFSAGTKNAASTTSIGANSGTALLWGNGDIYIGASAGSVVTNANSNIEIGNQGVANDGLTIRLGTAGTQTNFTFAGMANGNGAGLTNLQNVVVDTFGFGALGANLPNGITFVSLNGGIGTGSTLVSPTGIYGVGHGRISGSFEETPLIAPTTNIYFGVFTNSGPNAAYNLCGSWTLIVAPGWPGLTSTNFTFNWDEIATNSASIGAFSNSGANTQSVTYGGHGILTAPLMQHQ